MHATLPEDVLRQVLQREVSLHEIVEDGDRFVFALGLPEPHHDDKEGELSLNLQVNGKTIFNLSFTIVPGWVLKSEAPEALLIIAASRHDRGAIPRIRLARRALNDYSPRRLLLAALQGIADALGVDEIAAVSAQIRSRIQRNSLTIFENGYDRFFTKAGMLKLHMASILGPIPIDGKATGVI